MSINFPSVPATVLMISSVITVGGQPIYGSNFTDSRPCKKHLSQRNIVSLDKHSPLQKSAITFHCITSTQVLTSAITNHTQRCSFCTSIIKNTKNSQDDKNRSHKNTLVCLRGKTNSFRRLLWVQNKLPYSFMWLLTPFTGLFGKYEHLSQLLWDSIRKINLSNPVGNYNTVFKRIINLLKNNIE